MKFYKNSSNLSRGGSCGQTDREIERVRQTDRYIDQTDRHIDRNGEDFGRFSQYSADPLNP